MKYLIPLIAFLTSCTTPQIVSPLDKSGQPIHSVLKEPFFGAPNQASEWSFWYIVILAIVFWAAWREFKSIKWPKKKSSNTSASETTDSV
jgi:hypothetical protein